MPVLGDIANPLANHNDTRAKADVAEVGYYQSFLGSGITVELAGAERAGFYQYTFPDTNQTKNVIVDVSHVLSSYRGQGLQQAYLGGNIEVVNGNTSDGYYQGYGSYNNVSRYPLTVNTSREAEPDMSWSRVGTEHRNGPSTFAAPLIQLPRVMPLSSVTATPTRVWLRILPATV